MQRENPSGGPLRNGNPRGNPNLAPRCGARTRAGCACRAPAMANGRCRMHGGASTGPRTAAGLARLRAARTIHGGYGAASQARLRQMRAFIAGTRALLATMRRGVLPEPARTAGKSPCNVNPGPRGTVPGPGTWRDAAGAAICPPAARSWRGAVSRLPSARGDHQGEQ